MFGIGRFAIEQVRGDDLERLGRHSDPRLCGLTLVQYAAIALIAGSALLWRRSRALEVSRGGQGARPAALSLSTRI